MLFWILTIIFLIFEKRERKHFLFYARCNLHVLSRNAFFNKRFLLEIETAFKKMGSLMFSIPDRSSVNTEQQFFFLTFPACFYIPIFFSNLNSNYSSLIDMKNLQEQVKKAFCYQKLFWPFTVWTNCFSDLKFFVNSWPSPSNFKIFLDH